MISNSSFFKKYFFR